jgi:hypothetical protein
LPKVEAAYKSDLELVRLVLLDEAPKNSESCFIAWCLRWLRKNTAHKRVVSFSDPRFGHTGTVYRAANFIVLGKERGHGTRRIFVDGVEYHPKSAYDKWGCSGIKLQAKLRNNEVKILVCPPKNVFVFTLRKGEK